MTLNHIAGNLIYDSNKLEFNLTLSALIIITNQKKSLPCKLLLLDTARQVVRHL